MTGEGDVAMTNYKEPGDPCIGDLPKSCLVGKAYGLGKPRPGIPALNKRSQPDQNTKSLDYV